VGLLGVVQIESVGDGELRMQTAHGSPLDEFGHPADAADPASDERQLRADDVMAESTLISPPSPRNAGRPQRQGPAARCVVRQVMPGDPQGPAITSWWRAGPEPRC
jgi:hypothetical protein